MSHNTGLARDIHEQCLLASDSSKPLAELNTEDGHQRYYFPSNRVATGSTGMISDIKEESIEVAGSDAGNSDASRTKNTTINSKLCKSLLPPLPLPSAPRTPTTPISEILTPVSEPAFLLASLCSTMEKLPVSLGTPTDPHQDSALLQTYLRERAVQDARVKQSQYHPRLRKEGPDVAPHVGTPSTPTSNVTSTLSYSSPDAQRSGLTSTFTSVSQLISSQCSGSQQDTAISRMPPLVWAAQRGAIGDDSGRAATQSSAKVTCASQNSNSTASSQVNTSNIISSCSSPPLVPVKQEIVMSPINASSVQSSKYSNPNSNLESAMGSSIKTSSERDKISNVVCQSAPSTDSTPDVKLTCLPQSHLADDGSVANQSVITPVSSTGQKTVLPLSIPVEEAESTVPSVSGSLSTANSVIVTNSGSISPPLTSNSLSKKPKAEFMPPSSGPAPSYVR